MKQRFILLAVITCILLLLETKFFYRVWNSNLTLSSLKYPSIDLQKNSLNESIKLGFSTFDYKEAKRQETVINNQYDLTAVLLHWKRLNGLNRTIHYLLHTNLFKEIIIWNNNIDINLTVSHFNNDIQSHMKLVRIINSEKNLKDEAKYRACAGAKTRACFYVDDDHNPAHYLKCLIASFRSDPNLLHAVTDAYTYYTNLIWSYFDSMIDLHSGFSWIGCGSVFLRKYAQHHLQLMHKYLRNHTDLYGFGDVFFSVWLNEIPVQLNTILQQHPSEPSKTSVSFSRTRHFLHLQYTSSVLAIRILEQSLRFERSKKNDATFSRHRQRRFQSCVKSPSLNDDFIFYTNVLPLDFDKISFNSSRDFSRGTRKNLPNHPNVRYFQYHGTLKAVDADRSTCWHSHREIQSNDFFAIDFLSIQTRVMFTIGVGHSPRLQADLDVKISFDGLFWVHYQSTHGFYTKTNRTFEYHLHTYLFDSNEFDIGFRSFRYISFHAKKAWDHRFQVCEIEILSSKSIENILLNFEK